MPAGNYTLCAIPDANAWMLIVNRTQRDDIGRMSEYPGADSDLLRVPMTTSPLPSATENFTISFMQNGSSCALHFDWE